MKIPKIFEDALGRRNDTIWFEGKPDLQTMQKAKEIGNGIYLKKILAGKYHTIQMTHVYRSPTHHYKTLTHITSATGKGRSHLITREDDEALKKLLDNFERLSARNAAVERAMSNGDSVAFGFLVHPIIMISRALMDQAYSQIMSADSRLEVEGQRIVRFHHKNDRYEVRIEKSKPPIISVPGQLPETVRHGIESKQHPDLATLIDAQFPRRINIRKISERKTATFVGQNAIQIEMDTNFVRLAPVPEEYAGGWCEPKPGMKY